MGNLTSIVSYPERGAGGNNKYRGNCSPQVIKDLITHFGITEICDYMCGSNTTKDAADALGIKSHTYDLHSGFDLINHDIQERPGYIFWHPPYHDIIKYSGNMYCPDNVKSKHGYDPTVSDLSHIAEWSDFVKSMNYCMMKQYSSLQKGGRMAVLVGDIKKKGKLYSMLFELVKPGTLENVVIKTQHNCSSGSTRYSGNFIPIVHEYLLLLKKDDALIIPVLITQQRNADIRDIDCSTWRNVVSAVMESFPDTSCLENIYSKIDGHKKCSNNKHWKEKVRQTLQIYPEFVSTDKGKWQLLKVA